MQAMDWQDAETSTFRVERVTRFLRGAGWPARHFGMCEVLQVQCATMMRGFG